jgi:hypothetical protein
MPEKKKMNPLYVIAFSLSDSVSRQLENSHSDISSSVLTTN